MAEIPPLRGVRRSRSLGVTSKSKVEIPRRWDLPRDDNFALSSRASEAKSCHSEGRSPRNLIFDSGLLNPEIPRVRSG